jgi:hypothetical protein
LALKLALKLGLFSAGGQGSGVGGVTGEAYCVLRIRDSENERWDEHESAVYAKRVRALRMTRMEGSGRLVFGRRCWAGWG